MVPQPPREPVRAFHRGLPGYAPTPLHRLRGLAATLGLGEIYIKDESLRFGLDAFKVLGASWALHRVREQHAGSLTVSSATEGNHGRGLAWAARHLGLRAVIYIPRSAASARVDRLRREGADVVLVDGTYEDAVDRCAAESRANGWQVLADVGYGDYLEIPRTISEGYSTLFAEAEEQLAATAADPQADAR